MKLEVSFKRYKAQSELNSPLGRSFIKKHIYPNKIIWLAKIKYNNLPPKTKRTKMWLTSQLKTNPKVQ